MRPADRTCRCSSVIRVVNLRVETSPSTRLNRWTKSNGSSDGDSIRGVIGPLDFEVHDGQTAVITGRSGIGKTSLLETLVGLRPIRGGQIHLDAIDVTSSPPWTRAIGYVPQDRALFGGLCVRENIAMPMRLRRWPKKIMDATIDRCSKGLGIESLLDRDVSRLSGGEAARVTVARAIAFEPKTLLLDEPTAGLDETAAETLLSFVADEVRRLGCTVLHVTHDPRHHRDADQTITW